MYCAAVHTAKIPDAIAFWPAKSLKRFMAVETYHKADNVPPTRTHDDLLALVALRQDRAAFVELFEFFAPRVKSYLLKHGADEATAEEIVQNTFVTIWEKAKGFDPKKAAASTWIFTIARNKRIDMLRRQKFIEINSDDPALESTASEEKEDDYADKATVEKLHQAMTSLPEEQARLLRMAFFEDKSHQTISSETKIPLGTVKSRLRLAMDKLRLALKGGAV